MDRLRTGFRKGSGTSNKRTMPGRGTYSSGSKVWGSRNPDKFAGFIMVAQGKLDRIAKLCSGRIDALLFRPDLTHYTRLCCDLPTELEGVIGSSWDQEHPDMIRVFRTRCFQKVWNRVAIKNCKKLSTSSFTSGLLLSWLSRS